MKVDEARPGNIDLRDPVGRRQGGDQRLGDLARWQAQRFGQHQRQIGLEVTEARVLGGVNLRRGRHIQRPSGGHRGECGFEQDTEVSLH